MSGYGEDEPKGPGVIPIVALGAVVCLIVFWLPILIWLGWI